MNATFFGLLTTSRQIQPSTGGGSISYLINEDFEGAGTPAGWSAGESGRDYDSTDNPLQGAQSLKLTGPSKFTIAPAVINNEEFWMKFLFRTDTIPASSTFLDCLDSGFTSRLKLAVLSTGEIFLNCNGTSSQTTDSLVAGTNYTIWVRYNGDGVCSVEFGTGARVGSGNKYTQVTSSGGALVDKLLPYAEASVVTNFDVFQVALEDLA